MAASTTRVDDLLNSSADVLETAKQARQSHNYDRALAACRKARETAQSAQNIAEDKTPERVSKPETILGRINDLEKQIKHERDEHTRVHEALSALSKRVEDVARRVDSNPETALDRLDDIEDSLADVADQIANFEFSDAKESHKRLEQQCENLRDRAQEEIATRTSVPQTVPDAPRLSLTYNDLRKGDPLGKGGNADVYHTTVQADGERVEIALKEPRMSGTLHTEVVERMMDEAETWQRLDDHDHIVGVVDYGSEPLPWIAMEYMDGGHLGDRAGGFDFDQKLWTAIATTKAVRHAHRRGVAHLDLKPENVLFRGVEDAWDVPKVADWGLSRHLMEHSKSRDGMTVEYAAPEQFSDSASTDKRTDIYQLGAVFYELFTGQQPFEGEMFAVMKQIENERPTPPSEITDVPDGLDEVLLRTLAKNPQDRYSDIVYLRDDLRDLFEGFE